jgi:hypothetical protein
MPCLAYQFTAKPRQISTTTEISLQSLTTYEEATGTRNSANMTGSGEVNEPTSHSLPTYEEATGTGSSIIPTDDRTGLQAIRTAQSYMRESGQEPASSGASNQPYDSTESFEILTKTSLQSTEDCKKTTSVGSSSAKVHDSTVDPIKAEQIGLWRKGLEKYYPKCLEEIMLKQYFSKEPEHNHPCPLIYTPKPRSSWASINEGYALD